MVILLLSIFAHFNLIAQEDSSSELITSEIDWDTGRVRIDITQINDALDYNLPVALSRSRLAATVQAPELLFQALLGIQVDSSNSIASLIQKGIYGRSLLDYLHALSSSVVPLQTTPLSDLQGIRALYELNIYPELTSYFVRHIVPKALEEILEWQPHSNYSGIIIYAQEALPVYGENRTATLKPVLFPAIYDETMRVIVNRNRMLPEFARGWGGAAYSTVLDSSESFEDRIGSNPYRILAQGLFGLKEADPIISFEDAQSLLYSPSNQTLLREGRILILYTNP